MSANEYESEMQKKLRTLETDNAALLELLNVQETEITEQTTELATQATELAAQKKTLEMQAKQLEFLQTRIEQERKKVAEAAKKTEQIQAIQDKQAEVLSLEKTKLRQLEVKNERSENQLRAAKEEIGTLSEKLETSTEEAVILREDLEEMSALKETIRRLTAENKTLKEAAQVAAPAVRRIPPPPPRPVVSPKAEENKVLKEKIKEQEKIIGILAGGPVSVTDIQELIKWKEKQPVVFEDFQTPVEKPKATVAEVKPLVTPLITTRKPSPGRPPVSTTSTTGRKPPPPPPPAEKGMVSAIKNKTLAAKVPGAALLIRQPRLGQSRSVKMHMPPGSMPSESEPLSPKPKSPPKA